MDQKHHGILWDYDEESYQVTVSDIQHPVEPFGIAVPQTAENTLDVQILVEALRRIVARHETSP